MAEKSIKVCQFNQTGFCKFGVHCGKQHENQVCDDIYDCKNNKCIKRHPQICRYYDKNEKCRFKEGCAYIHEKKGAKQDILNEQIKNVVMKHENDIKTLSQEVNMLKALVQNMTLEMVKALMQEVQNKEKDECIDNTMSMSVTIEDTEENKKEECDDIEVTKNKMLFQCDECEFECEEQITLNKHKNTKHTKVNSQKDNSVNKAPNTKDKFHCDKCSYSSMSTKSLKKHRSQKHQIPQTALQIKCDKCKITFEEKTELLAHVEEKHCSCTPDSVCDECLNYWVHKSQ